MKVDISLLIRPTWFVVLGGDHDLDVWHGLADAGIVGHPLLGTVHGDDRAPGPAVVLGDLWPHQSMRAWVTTGGHGAATRMTRSSAAPWKRLLHHQADRQSALSEWV